MLVTAKFHARRTRTPPQHSQMVLLLRSCVLVYVYIVRERSEAFSCTLFCVRNNSDQHVIFHLHAGRRKTSANMCRRCSFLCATTTVCDSSCYFRRRPQLDGCYPASDRLSLVGRSCTEGTFSRIVQRVCLLHCVTCKCMRVMLHECPIHFSAAIV
jgi:hypothetical protein